MGGGRGRGEGDGLISFYANCPAQSVVTALHDPAPFPPSCLFPPPPPPLVLSGSLEQK